MIEINLVASYFTKRGVAGKIASSLSNVYFPSYFFFVEFLPSRNELTPFTFPQQLALAVLT
jgi:hypothetical protein